MKSDFLIAINQLCAERGLPREVVLDAVKMALISAYKRDFGASQNINVKLDPATGRVQVIAYRKVVAEVQDDKLEINLEEALKLNPESKLEDMVEVEVTPPNFGRIAAQTAKQVILQRIREAERDALFLTYADQEGEIVAGTVQAVESQAVTLGLGKAEALLSRNEQIPGERYRVGQRLRAYVYEVQRTPRGPQIMVTRASRKMLRRLLELEVPEIFNGIVEIKAIAREAGSRSKVAVGTIQAGVDPVGACVGMRGVRIQNIVNELNGEKVDVVAWDSDPRVFIANALSPAQVVNVELLPDDPEGKTALVVVPDGQLSLAIGKQGQNARLAAKLTGWRIDIKSSAEAAQLAVVRAKKEAEAQARREAWLQREEAQVAALLVFAKATRPPLPPEPEIPATPPVQVVEEAQPAPEVAPEPPVEEVVAEEKAPEPVVQAGPAEPSRKKEEAYVEPVEKEWEGPRPKGKKKKEGRRARGTIFDEEELGEELAETLRQVGGAQDWKDALREFKQRSQDK